MAGDIEIWCRGEEGGSEKLKHLLNKTYARVRNSVEFYTE